MSEPTSPSTTMQTPSSSSNQSIVSTPAAAETPATSVSSSGTPAPGQSTSSYLESICTGGVQATNDRDLDFRNGGLYKNVAPNFRAHFENFPHPLTLAEHSNIVRQTIEQFPDYHVEVVSVNSDVDEDAGTATVFMETEVTGAPAEIRTFLMNEFKFRREKGVWRCTQHHGMKGIGDHNQLFGRGRR